MPLLIDHAVHAPEIELLARDAQQPELGIELHFSDRESVLDQLLRNPVGAVFIRAEVEIPLFAYAEIHWPPLVMAAAPVSRYNHQMLKKPLIETNPHLRGPEKYRQGLVANVASSTAIETGALASAVALTLAAPRERSKPKKRLASAR